MTNLALRLLELQQEFVNIDDLNSAAAEFQQPDWQARDREAIAAEYGETLRQFLAS